MEPDFPQELKTLSANLSREFVFREVTSRYDAAVFGNAYVVLENTEFRMRLVKDRGEIAFEFASLTEPEQWYDYSRVAAFLNGDASVIHPTAIPAFIRDNLISLSQMFQVNSLRKKAVMNNYEDLAKRYGVSVGAVEALARALQAGGGEIAQFSHPDLGGMGQWMPGMVMVGDMFNNALKAKVDGLCTELSQTVGTESPVAPMPPMAGFPAPWWPETLGIPSSRGGQNEWQYAYFPAANRLALRQEGRVTVYDTTGYDVSGVSQQQSGGHRVVVFTSPQGTLDLNALKQVQA